MQAESVESSVHSIVSRSAATAQLRYRPR